MNRVLLLVSVIILSSCSSKKEKQVNNNTENIVTINVDVDAKIQEGEFNKYFKSYDVISLETQKESLLSRVNKLEVFDRNFFILDKKANGVFVFSSEGKFINKIGRIGRGPQEYIGLQDFTINREKGEILFLTHRPAAIYRYDLKGEFIVKERLKHVYKNINVIGDEVLLFNAHDLNEELVTVKNLKTGSERKFLEKTSLDKKFNDYGIGASYLVKGESLYLNVPYKHTIYEYKKGDFIPKYKIDFKDDFISSEEVEEMESFSEALKHGMSNNLAFTVSSFVENENYLLFKYNLSQMVIYSKKTQTSECIKRFKHNNISFSNYIEYDQMSNKLITIMDTSSLRKYKGKEEWEKIPQKLKDVVENANDFDNPSLLIYYLK